MILFLLRIDSSNVSVEESEVGQRVLLRPHLAFLGDDFSSLGLSNLLAELLHLLHDFVYLGCVCFCQGLALKPPNLINFPRLIADAKILAFATKEPSTRSTAHLLIKNPKEKRKGKYFLNC